MALSTAGTIATGGGRQVSHRQKHSSGRGRAWPPPSRVPLHRTTPDHVYLPFAYPEIRSTTPPYLASQSLGHRSRKANQHPPTPSTHQTKAKARPQLVSGHPPRRQFRAAVSLRAKPASLQPEPSWDSCQWGSCQWGSGGLSARSLLVVAFYPADPEVPGAVSGAHLLSPFILILLAPWTDRSTDLDERRDTRQRLDNIANLPTTIPSSPPAHNCNPPTTPPLFHTSRIPGQAVLARPFTAVASRPIESGRPPRDSIAVELPRYGTSRVDLPRERHGPLR